jgi:hypothetical protein
LLVVDQAFLSGIGADVHHAPHITLEMFGIAPPCLPLIAAAGIGEIASMLIR